MNLFNIGGNKDGMIPPHAEQDLNFSNQTQTVEEELKGISLFYEELAGIYGLENITNPDDVIKEIYKRGDTYTNVLDKLAKHYNLPAGTKYDDIWKASGKEEGKEY